MSDNDVMPSTFIINEDHPCLPGHFPGNPIVPGVIVLNHALHEVMSQHPGLQVTGIKKLKLLQTLRPCQQVTIECQPPTNDTLRFRCYHKQQLLADGKLFIAHKSGY